MLTQITDYGVALMQTATAPIVISSFELGSSFGYIPTPTQAGILGTKVYEGVPADPVIETTNFVKYYIELSNILGPFAFGEIALFYGEQLFAICVLDGPQEKTPLDPNTNTGGAIVIDFNVPAVGLNYQMWTNVAQANTMKVSQVAGPEELPQIVGTAPNLYVVDSTSGVKPFLAYTDRSGLWTFDTYSAIGSTTAVEATQQTIKITSEAAADLQIAAGTVTAVLIQVASGKGYASARWVTNATIDGLNGGLILQLNAPIWSETPVLPGDALEFYRYGSPSSTTINLSAILTVKEVTGDYTLTLPDQEAVYIVVNSPAPTTIYVPDNADVALPKGTSLLIGWEGPGQVMVAPGSGNVTIRTPSTNMIAQRYGKIALIQRELNLWELEGNLQQT